MANKMEKMNEELTKCRIQIQKNDRKFNMYDKLATIFYRIHLRFIGDIFFNKMKRIYAENKEIQAKMLTIYTLIGDTKKMISMYTLMKEGETDGQLSTNYGS